MKLYKIKQEYIKIYYYRINLIYLYNNINKSINKFIGIIYKILKTIINLIFEKNGENKNIFLERESKILNKKGKIRDNSSKLCQKFLIKIELSSEKYNIKKKKNKNRKSHFRGVSKNGNKWQVLIKHKNKNTYIGIYPSEILAARIYDIASIKTKGIKAHTNFMYSNNQILSILNTEINYKYPYIIKRIYELLD